MEKRKKRLIISIIIFSILLLTTIFLAIKVNNTNNLNYEKVECNVSRMEKYWIKRQQKYKIYCMYNGDEKKIKNVKNDYYNYSKGKNVDAYLYNNKLYANYEGIKTSTLTAVLYFVFLFITIGSVIFPICFYIDCKKEKKSN